LKYYTHKGVDKKSKTFYLNGKGSARARAWGAERIHSSLSAYTGETLQVNLTEKVGNNTWYRGKINGKGQNVWIHSSVVTDSIELSTSKLGRIKSNDALIYDDSLENSSAQSAGNKYTNRTFYIKKMLKEKGSTYYLISYQPSSTKETIGWVKSNDLKYYTHKGVDKKSKTFYLNGKGSSRPRAWGAERVHSSLSKHAVEMFKANLTDKVGKNTWYRGKINGKGQNVWVHSSAVDKEKETIVIDAGHGGYDSDKSGNGLGDKANTLEIYKRVKRKVEDQDYKVIMTRTIDKYVSLNKRTDLANDSSADLFVSIHVNSGGGNGPETWWYNKGYKPTESKRLAQLIQKEVIKETKANNRGIKNGNLHVNRESKMPSSLVEVGFIDNKQEAKKLNTKSYQERIAKGIVSGIEKYF